MEPTSRKRRGCGARDPAWNRAPVDRDRAAGSLLRWQRYQLTPLGEQRLSDRTPRAADPWEPGARINGEFAIYDLVDRYNFDGRGEMYHARVARILNRRELPWCAEGSMVVIKCISTQFPPVLGVEAITRYIRVVNDALASEFPALRRLNNLPSVPRTFDYGYRPIALRSGIVSVRFLVQELIDGEPLPRYLRLQSDTPKKKFSGSTRADDWFTFAESLVSGLKAVHNIGTFHRDIWKMNIVVKPDGQPVFGDIGDAVFRKADFSKLPNEEAALPYVAPEQRGRPVTPSRRADIYALGGILYYLATGEDPSFEGMSNDEALKRAIFAKLFSVRDGALRQNFGISEIISRCLRVGVDKRVASANQLLQDLRVFRPPTSLPSPARAPENLRRLVGQLTSSRDKVFRSLATVELSELEDRLQGMSAGDVVVEGSRDSIVLKLTSYLSTLGEGDEYWTVTVPRFWNSRNIGIRGRYLTMNLEVARRGAKIRRVFLLTESDRRHPETHDIIRAQLEFQRRFKEIDRGKTAAGEFDTRFLFWRDDEIEQIVGRGEQKGVWMSGGSAVELLPVYDSVGVIRLVHIRTTDVEKVREWFNRYYKDAAPLGETWAFEDK